MALQVAALLPEGLQVVYGCAKLLLMIAQRCDVIVDSETSTAQPRSELCAESKEGQDASKDDS